jgi:AcrR family transcriptional regulator
MTVALSSIDHVINIGNGTDSGAMSSTSPRRSAAERLAQIAEAAEQLARTEGLEAITLRALAARIGVAPALIAHYRPRMDAVVADAFTAVTASELVELAARAALIPDPVDRLAAVLTQLREPDPAITLVWVHSWALGRRNPTLASHVGTQMDRWRAFLADLVAALPAPDRVDPALAGGQILGMIDGLNAHSLVGWAAGEDDLLPRAVEAMVGLPPGALSERDGG